MVPVEVGVIYTREQFVAWWDQWVPENPANRRDHPLWIPEMEIKPGPPSAWFVKASSRNNWAWRIGREDYWAWCNANCSGIIRCYMLDEEKEEEWWGFTNKDDMVIWMLKWA